MSYLSPSLTLLTNAVKKASGSLNRDFSEIEQLQSSVKGYKEFVVASYTKVSKALQVELGKIHPDYALVSEAEKLGARNCYIVSPIDGLSNFAHGIPHFAVSVAVYENNTVTASVVYNPATDCLYFAEKGKGAYKEGFRNHERLRVSSRRDLKEALVATLVNYNENVSEYDVIQKRLVAATDNLRISGSCALDLAYVASGKYDAAVSRGNKLSDFAAGLLLVKEAGGYIYDIDQKDKRTENLSLVLNSGNIFAVNNELGKKLGELFSE